MKIEMDSQTKISDFSSNASTEIIPDNTSQETDIKIHNKISIVKDNMKIELESKGTVTQPGNILYLSSFAKPWLNLVEKLSSKKFWSTGTFTFHIVKENWTFYTLRFHTFIHHCNNGIIIYHFVLSQITFVHFMTIINGTKISFCGSWQHV